METTHISIHKRDDEQIQFFVLMRYNSTILKNEILIHATNMRESKNKSKNKTKQINKQNYTDDAM